MREVGVGELSLYSKKGRNGILISLLESIKIIFVCGDLMDKLMDVITPHRFGENQYKMDGN